MKPTMKELDRWSQQFPWRDNPPTICSLCGSLGTLAYIQPIHPHWIEITPEYSDAKESPFIPASGIMYRCCHGPCAERVEAARKARRKAQLAEERRCDVQPFCNARATWTLGGHHLCGKHKTQVLTQVTNHIARSGLGGLALFGDIGQSQMLHSAINQLKGVSLGVSR